jgi:cytochrome P450
MKGAVFFNQLNYASSVGLLIVTTVIIILYRFFYFLRKLPPLSPDSPFFTVKQLTGNRKQDYLLKTAKRIGPIFRWNIPTNKFSIVVSDVKLARLVLEGDEKTGLRGGEKPEVYKVLDGPRKDPSMFAMKTYGTRHEIYRKSMASSFSNMNLYKILPKLSQCLLNFAEFAQKKIQSNESFNISDLFLRLIFDALTTSMFNINFHAMEANSEGEKFLHELEIWMEEFMLKQQVLGGLRRSLYYFLPALQRAHQADKYIVSLQYATHHNSCKSFHCKSHSLNSLFVFDCLFSIGLSSSFLGCGS